MFRHASRGLVLMLLLSGSAWAWPMATNQRIDRALYSGHDSRSIVAGRIEAHLIDALADEARELAPPLSEVVFHVEHVLLGEDVEAGTRLRFSTRNFMWPVDLVPMKKNAQAFLIYDTRREGGFDGFPWSVAPWSGKAPGPVENRDQAQRLLAMELIATLEAERSLPRQRALVLQMLPILTPAQAEAAFTPLLEANDVWLRRAAIAGLACASPKAAHVERAVADLGAFIEHTPAQATIDACVDGHQGGYAAYGLLFRYYAFLETNWSEEERQGLRHCLPLFRVIARELGKSPHYQWEFGLSPLCLLGDADDLGALLAYYAAHETRPEGLISERPHVRLAVLRKLAALLDVEFVAREEHGGIRDEKEQRRLIHEALAKRKSIESGKGD